MATKKKALQAAAGAAGAGEAVYIDDIFATYLYTGNSSAQTITNGIDLDGEGGMVWLKSRTVARSHFLADTERGSSKTLSSDSTGAETTDTTRYTAFNSNGFSVGSSSNTNNSAETYASWTFRKAPGFFDVVTYTGDGVLGREIPHNLGCDVGFMVIKNLDSAEGWPVFHKGMYAADPDGAVRLDDTSASTNYLGDYWYGAEGGTVIPPTDTVFTVGSDNAVNGNGFTYVAYLFADGDDAAAQIFGTDGDQAVVKCGTYNTGSYTDVEVDCGFEPQWLLVKNADTNGGSWYLVDCMRGISTGGNDNYLTANGSGSEGSAYDLFDLTSTGFISKMTLHTTYYGNNQDVIYIAIRRPHKPAESGTEVFAVDTLGESGTATDPGHNSGFVADMALRREADYSAYFFNSARLISGRWLRPTTTDAEYSSTQPVWDYMDGFREVASASAQDYAWMFKRSPGFFDVVCYTGDGVAGRTVDHNLGVVPEMIIVKKRSGTGDWFVYHTGVDVDSDGNPHTDLIYLNYTNAAVDSAWLNDTAPTDSQFTLNSYTGINASGSTYIAYLFASQDGISKVGSYTGNGTTDGSHVIDCGFTSGARFVLIKVASGASGKWHVYDTERGITVGTDGALFLDSTEAENTTFDGVDPASSGFAPKHGYTNYSGREYIYLAIA